MRAGCLGLLLMLLAVALAGCGMLSGVTSVATQGPTLQTDSATAEVAAEATPTAPPTPSPQATTTQASAVPTPDVALTSRDYYVVERNQRAGVVDKTGRVVLPFAFSKISKLGAYYWDNVGAEDRNPTAFFLAVPYELKQGDSTESGFYTSTATLYNATGLAVTDETYSGGFYLNDGLLALCRSSANRGWGVMDTAGRIIVPFQYNQIVRYAQYLVGCDDDAKKMDFYDDAGKLQTTLAGSSGYVTQGYLTARDVKDRFGLLGASLQWLFLGQYQNVRPVAPDRFIGDDGTVSRLIDAQGKDVLPKPYRSIDVALDEDGKLAGYVCATETVPVVAAYDAQGKLIFESNAYTGLQAAGPYYIAYYNGGSHALDAEGRRVLTNITANVQYWWGNVGLFECYSPDRGSASFVRPDGTAVPLPANRYAQCLSADRFLVAADDTHYGISDAQGHWVVPPDYTGLYPMSPDDKTLAATSGDGLCGIMDYDGKWLMPAVFESVYGPLDGLLQARKGDRTGLLDWAGHWVWFTSDYDALDD